MALSACGSGETKTVTETVKRAEAAGTPGARDGTPTAGTRGAVPTATEIPDGTWAKGEYTPGTYRAPGGELCSWEKRQSLSREAEGTGNWGGAEKNIVAEVDSPYFKTEGCGVWEKVD
jgi:hypothetical protein